MVEIQEKINEMAKGNKRILLYGAGKYATYLFENYDFSKLNIIGIADKRFENENDKKYLGKYDCIPPSKISEIDCDIICVILLDSQFLQSFFAKIKKKIVYLKEKLVKDAYIISNINGSFKEYLTTHNMLRIINEIKKGLDENSIGVFENTIRKILNLPDTSIAQHCRYSLEFIESLASESDKKHWEIYKSEYLSYEKKYKMTKNEYNGDVFFYHHGLRFASKKIKDYIKGKDFIDGGAYIGDSALVLFNYKPSKIYSFELSEGKINEYKETMRLNNIFESKYEIINMGLSDKNKIVFFADTQHQGTTTYQPGNSKLKCCDVDSFVLENNLNVGFIKTDVEGAGYDVLKGMKKTLKKFRPVLCLSIYHSPQEFFETKPLLDKITKDLNYKIEIQYQGIWGGFINETVLFAYPKELVGAI